MLLVPRSGFGMDDMAKEWLKGMRDCSRVDRAGCRAALIVQGRVCVSGNDPAKLMIPSPSFLQTPPHLLERRDDLVLLILLLF